ncbi:hypothetical protein KY290_005161 [Solanum tuberosum]|uniref:Uncharacterized protein n=1 Tax=Solanum tuberosum TaxID=4113 RepID=A0ABQ7WDE0_SOLTU|nr:hypothetical protein KY289_005556 [Solanum tuberosum]KAH0778734.1 hypothetical protein KY290_005161 [Solanum tuberosum]
MAGQNEVNLPFIRFPNVASWERHHDNCNTGFCCEKGFVLHKLEEKAPTFHACLMEFGWAPLTKVSPDARSTWDDSHPVIRIQGVDIPLNATTVNEALEVPEVSNAEYEAKLREMDLEWLRDNLVEPERWDQEDLPVEQPHRRDLSLGLGGGVRHTGYRAECGGADHFRVEDALPG